MTSCDVTPHQRGVKGLCLGIPVLLLTISLELRGTVMGVPSYVTTIRIKPRGLCYGILVMLLNI